MMIGGAAAAAVALPVLRLRRCRARLPWCALAVVSMGLLFSVDALAQDRSSRWDPDWDPPRTAWGHPDLQGNWSSATITPLQRPRDQGPTLSWEEVERLEGRAANRLERVSRPSDPDRGAPRAGGGVGGYNGIYIDAGDVVAKVYGEPRSSLITHPDDGRVPELTPAAQARRAERRESRSQFGQYDHPELRPLGERCLVSFGSNAGPPMLPNGFYNNNYTIVQTPDHVVIMAEMVHDARIIKIGDGPRLPEHIRPWMGDSWGHWEGDVLVVETTNIHPLHRYSGEEMKVIERFSRPSENFLNYQVTVEDPVVLAQPFVSAPMRWSLAQGPDDVWTEYLCTNNEDADAYQKLDAEYRENYESGGGPGR